MNTNASSQTQYFGFPLFAGTDKPSVLTDWNGTMEALDTVLEDYRTRIAGCEQTTGSFMDQVNILKDKFTQVEARISADEELIQDNSLEIVALKEAMIVADTSIKRILTEITTLATKTEVQAVASSVDTVSSDLATLSDHVDTLWSHITKTDAQAGSALSKSNPLAIFMYDAWDREKRYVSGDIVTHLYLDPNLNSNIVGLFKAKNEVGPVPSANENPYSDTTNWENITFVNYLFNISTFDARIRAHSAAIMNNYDTIHDNTQFLTDSLRDEVDSRKNGDAFPLVRNVFENFYGEYSSPSDVWSMMIQADKGSFLYDSIYESSAGRIEISGINIHLDGNVLSNPDLNPYTQGHHQVFFKYFRRDEESVLNMTGEIVRDVFIENLMYNSETNTTIARLSLNNPIIVSTNYMKTVTTNRCNFRLDIPRIIAVSSGVDANVRTINQQSPNNVLGGIIYNAGY